MSSNNKVTIRNTVSFISTRTEENLPFVTCLLMNVILWAIMARARKLFDVTVCHFIFMANHLHLLVVTNNPEHTKEFIGYIKRESAHLINRLLGRKKKTIWCEGYDDPKVLCPKDVIRYIVYIYLNPVKAKLVPSIDQYPGISSWKMFITNTRTKVMKWYGRSNLVPISSTTPDIREQREYLSNLFKEAKSTSKFKLEPWAWIRCFPELKSADIGRIKKTILDCINKGQQELRQTGEFLGAEKLQQQSIDKSYRPTKHSKRMICICSDLELRKAFISWYKSQRDRARELIRNLKQGFTIPDFPSGFFAPGGTLLSNLITPP